MNIQQPATNAPARGAINSSALWHLDTPTVIRLAFRGDGPDVPLGRMGFYENRLIDFICRVTSGEILWR